MYCLVVYCKLMYELFCRYEFSKITDRIDKNFFNHRAPMQWNGSFWPKFTFQLHISIRYTRRKHAVHSYLRTRTTDHSEYWWVILLIICWNFEYVNSLSLRDTHRFKKAKYWVSRTFAVKKGIFHPVGTPRLTNQTLKRWRKLRMKA
jgi:hypothetical protein